MAWRSKCCNAEYELREIPWNFTSDLKRKMWYECSECGSECDVYDDGKFGGEFIPELDEFSNYFGE